MDPRRTPSRRSKSALGGRAPAGDPFAIEPEPRRPARSYSARSSRGSRDRDHDPQLMGAYGLLPNRGRSRGRSRGGPILPLAQSRQMPIRGGGNFFRSPMQGPGRMNSAKANGVAIGPHGGMTVIRSGPPTLYMGPSLGGGESSRCMKMFIWALVIGGILAIIISLAVHFGTKR
ncbi:hypothetical protein FQN57_005953 [Myotisia sp. PD_48]|nr:hypothetical protein FQN57_005953 [Myotisia sp. PD_48]